VRQPCSRVLTAVLFVAAVMVSTPTFGASAQSCAIIAKLRLPNTIITSAAVIPAGPFTPPAGLGPTTAGPVTENQLVRYGAVTVGSPSPVRLPSFCRVQLIVRPMVKIEVWLPMSGWNGKFEGVGNGGLAGVISYTALVNGVKLGYATASTDTGHEASDESWALGHPERIAEFGYLAIHKMTETARKVVDAFYGTEPKYSYFSGCSTGGKQALTEAQRYPDDYNGILAGGPANYMTDLLGGNAMWSIIVTTKDPGSYLPSSKLGILNDASVAACDTIDGIKDGVINDPRECHFNPSVLLCKGGDSTHCLTAQQVETVRALYAGPHNAAGRLIYPGIEPGYERSWVRFITGTQPGNSHNFDLAVPFLKYFVFDDAAWNYRTWNFDQDLQTTDRKLESILNATDPNLSLFRDHGGKLLIYHGWQDSGIPPLNTIRYYKSVVAYLHHTGEFTSESENFVRDANDTESFARLFMVPGVEHCDRLGGPGPDRSNFFGAMVNWVERGQPPDSILASHVASGKVTMTRPLCPFPLTAQYTGHGSIDDASNFACRLPN
jgi:Tannase and feruloyl esterase